jgi:hypothetical protein
MASVYTAQREDVRALVVEMCKMLDAIEFERKVTYNPLQIKAAALAALKIDSDDKIETKIALFDESYEELDSYNDIDLSIPEYEGMDDPL